MEEWFGVEKGALIATLLPAFSWLLMAVIFDPILSVLMYILNYALGNMRDPIFSDYTNRHIESRNRATVISAMYVAGSIYHMIVRPVIGAIADIDIRYVFIALACIIFFGAFLFRITEEDVVK